MIFGLFRKSADSEAVYAVYSAIVAQSRRPVFYAQWGVPDTVTGRFDMISLHISLLFRRLRSERKDAATFSQAVFDLFFRDMDRSLREMGATDLGVPKKIQKMGNIFYGLLAHLNEAMDKGDRAALEAVLTRNIYESAEAPAAALSAVTDDAIIAGAAGFAGTILQRPSSVSAIKVDGRRAYALAREGAPVELAPRSVTVSAFDVLAIRRSVWIDVDVRVDCSSGTYIRALARDLGDLLGVGGHLTALRRTRIGPFRVDAAVGLEEPLAERMLAPAAVAASLHPRLDLTAQEAVDLAHGKRIALAGAGTRAAVAPDGRLVGLVEAVDGKAVVLVNFPPDPTAPSRIETQGEQT